MACAGADKPRRDAVHFGVALDDVLRLPVRPESEQLVLLPRIAVLPFGDVPAVVHYSDAFAPEHLVGLVQAVLIRVPRTQMGVR
mgnify:CR=1 FL=1